MDLPEHPLWMPPGAEQKGGDQTGSRGLLRPGHPVEQQVPQVETCAGLPSGYVRIANWKMAQLKLIYLLKVVIFHSYVKLYQRVYHN